MANWFAYILYMNLAASVYVRSWEGDISNKLVRPHGHSHRQLDIYFDYQYPNNINWVNQLNTNLVEKH